MLNHQLAPNGSTSKRHRVSDPDSFIQVCDDFEAVHEPVQLIRGVGVAGCVTQEDQPIVLVDVTVARNMNS